MFPKKENSVPVSEMRLTDTDRDNVLGFDSTACLHHKVLFVDVK